jgi:hypothetical protein
VFVLLVGDLAKLSTICLHSFKKAELYCKICHISMAPCWSIATHHILTSSIRDTIDPIFLEFLNVIRIFKTHKNRNRLCTFMLLYFQNKVLVTP